MEECHHCGLVDCDFSCGITSFFGRGFCRRAFACRFRRGGDRRYPAGTNPAAESSGQQERPEALFRLAKNVRGWGRIHAVEFLKPETKEIQDWLLFEGADNNVLGQYSADTCLQKSGAESRLDAGLSAREHEAIGKLIQTALEPGPCPGVTDVDILPKFLVRGKEFSVDLELRQLIFDHLGN